MFKFDEPAEKLNGRVAMVALMFIFGTYLTTGELIPGVL